MLAVLMVLPVANEFQVRFQHETAGNNNSFAFPFINGVACQGHDATRNFCRLVSDTVNGHCHFSWYFVFV